MSLATPPSQTEEHGRYDGWGDVSPTGSQRRKMSFNPIGEWVPPVAHEEPVGAFEVSKGKRVLQVTVAVIYCLLAAGIVFGYAALKPVLISEGVYRDLCTQDELDRDVRVCYNQELRLNFMFTVAAVSTNVAALPIGTILDRYGPRVCGIISSVLLALGSLFFAFARQLPFDGYIPGYFLLALGGPFVFISSFQLSNAFPQRSGLVLALLTGAFDTSSAVFLGYRLAYQASGRAFHPHGFFLAYLVVPAFVLAVQLSVMPRASYKTVGELVQQAKATAHSAQASDDDERPASADAAAARVARHSRRESVLGEIASLLGPRDGAAQAAREEEVVRRASGVWGAQHGRPAAAQVRSWWFALIALFTVVQMTRINYFVATVRPQYEYLLGSHAAAVRVNEFFDAALPAGGVLAIPFIGLVLDNTSTPFVLALLVGIATAIGVLGVIPQLWAAYANVVLFVVYRPLYYTAVSDYAAKVFGFATFGKVYGLIICLAGLLNLSQPALDALTHGAFGDDPVPVNLALLAVGLAVGVAMVGYVWRMSRTVGRRVLRGEARGAEERLMPGADVEALEALQGERGYGGVDGER